MISPIEWANQVEDGRLSALYGVKAGQELQSSIDDVKSGLAGVEAAEKYADHLDNTIFAGSAEDMQKFENAKAQAHDNAQRTKDNMLNINIGFGTQHSESESDSTTIVNQGSNIKAQGDVTITSSEEDINIKGSNVEGENVTLNAAKDLNVTASKDSNVTEQDSESSSANIGVSIGTGGLLGVNAGYSKGEETIDANSSSYNESTVTANKELDFTSGEDTNIVGGKLSGEKVTGNVGGDLNIESLQDSNSYNEETKSGSLGLEYDLGTGKVGITGGYSEGNIDSDYKSVTDQSGIYAGSEGFDIYVEDNTELKGGIISGKNTDENKLSTGTLTYEDIKNEAEYEAGSHGIGIDTSEDAKRENADVTPNEGMPVSNETESTTKATVSEGEIEIRDKENQKQDLAGLNRDTQNALNKLGEIFDKDDIEEKQEFIGLAQEIGHNMIGDLTGKISDEQKAMLNTFFEGLISQWANGDFLSGASGAAVTEAAQEALNNIEDPAVRQIAVGLLSAAITKAAGGNASAAASAGISTEKYNYLTHEEYEEIIKSITRYNHKALAEGEILDRHRDEEWLEEHKNDKEDYRTEDGIPVYLPVKVGVDINGQDVYLIPGPNGGKLSMGSIVNGTPDMIIKLQNFDFKNLQDGQFYTVSNSIGYGTYGISLSLTITNTGDVFKEIQITSSATIGPDILKDITKISGTVSESYGTVEYNGKPVNDSELIKQVLSGTSLVISGNVLSSNASVSGLFSINKSMAEGTEIGTTLAGVQAGFGAAEYLGKINEL